MQEAEWVARRVLRMTRSFENLAMLAQEELVILLLEDLVHGAEFAHLLFLVETFVLVRYRFGFLLL